MSGLRTPLLDKFGVAEALANLVAQTRSDSGAPEIEYHTELAFDRLEPVLENGIFRIAQEALANACQHSGNSAGAGDVNPGRATS